jgi:antirestriction protein ArdC
MTTTDSTNDIYSRVTRQIIAAIWAGAGEWRMLWHRTRGDGFAPVNAASLKPCRGVNVLCLGIAAQLLGYPTGFWGTYRQWQDLGAQVRKSEKSARVVFWKVSAPIFAAA